MFPVLNGLTFAMRLSQQVIYREQARASLFRDLKVPLVRGSDPSFQGYRRIPNGKLDSRSPGFGVWSDWRDLNDLCGWSNVASTKRRPLPLGAHGNRRHGSRQTRRAARLPWRLAPRIYRFGVRSSSCAGRERSATGSRSKENEKIHFTFQN